MTTSTPPTDPTSESRRPSGNALWIALGLGIALLVISFLRIVGNAGSAAFGGKIIEATLSQPIWGTALAGRLAYFGAAVLSVHVALAVACWLLGRWSDRAWPQGPHSQRTWTLAWFLLLAAWILVANATWYPSSALGSPYASLVQQQAWGLQPLDLLTTAILLLAGIVAFKSLRGLSWRSLALPKRTLVTATASALLVAVLLVTPHLQARMTPPPGKPHVILIGLDSLRTDAVHGDIASAPVVRQFLDESTLFTDTVTPLARTFPAWVSIVSGRHPHTTGAVINLFPRELIDAGETLPSILRRAGYQTTYAIDEVRFSNLDESYGFDRMIAPPIGATDFMLGFFADLPLANILTNTRAGQWLFPYAHGNRAAAITYEPDTFTARLERELDFSKPTFLAVHLTLAHWPYSWASSAPKMKPDGTPDAVGMYTQAVERLDRQFADVLQILREQGALDNAIVVVLSDHGESLGEISTEHLAPVSHTDEEHSEIYGHGTNVLAESQYRVVLGMRAFGPAAGKVPAGLAVDAPTSLEDIAPTVVDLLDLEAPTRFDGVSLVPLLAGADPAAGTALQSRIRFMETEFNPPGVALGQTISTSALRKAAEYYRIDPDTDRIQIRDEHLGDILSNRQYAATRDGQILASIPTAGRPGQHIVYFDGQDADGRWIDSEAELLADPDASSLWQALTARFAATREPIVPANATP